MSTTLFPVQGSPPPAAAPPGDETASRAAEPAGRPAAPDREALLRQGEPSRVALGGRVAEFSYDPQLDRIIVRVKSGAGPDGELVRQIPPQEYVNFVSRFREMLGVLLNETF